MNTVICQDGNNPYSNNPHATEIEPWSQVIHERRIYTILSYEIKIKTWARVIKIIQVVALAIISCFIALAFQSIRKMWWEAVKRPEYVNVLMPQNFIRFLRHRNENLTSLDFFLCTQINDLSFLRYCPNLTSLDLRSCRQINDFSFLQHCPNLTSLNLRGCSQIDDLSVLQLCPNLRNLDLAYCREINDFSFLSYCPNLTTLDLIECHQINDISIQAFRDRGIEVLN